MYGYSEIITLSPEEILQEISQEDIFGIFIKEKIIADKDKATYVAPYRDDKNPACYFEEYEGKLCFIDFADTLQSKDCFGLVSKCTGLNFKDSLQYIVKHFSLGKGNRPKRNVVIKKENEVVEVKKIKKNRTITYAPREFNGKDKKFWTQYKISRKELIEDKVIPITLYKSINRKGEPFIIQSFDLMYAYTDFEDGKAKIYRPYGNKDEKWFTNCTQNDIGGVNHLPSHGDLLVISKSYKDYRVLRNQGLNSVWFQNEGMIPSPTLLVQLCKRFSKIIVWFDNDNAGIKASRIVSSHINSLYPGKSRPIYLDTTLLEEKIKDPSDLIAKKGEEELIKFLKDKKILKNNNNN